MKTKPISFRIHPTLIPVLSLLLLFPSCNRNPHFITDKEYRQQVESDFATRSADLNFGALSLCLDTLNRAEREAMQFL